MTTLNLRESLAVRVVMIETGLADAIDVNTSFFPTGNDGKKSDGAASSTFI